MLNNQQVFHGVLTHGPMRSFIKEQEDHIEIETPDDEIKLYLKHLSGRYRIADESDSTILTPVWEGTIWEKITGNHCCVFYHENKPILSLCGNGMFNGRSAKYNGKEFPYEWKVSGKNEVYSTDDFEITDYWGQGRIEFNYKHPYLFECLSCIIDHKRIVNDVG